MPLVDMKEPPEQPEPQTFCDSCWYYDAIQDSRFGVVLYCNYDEEAYVDYEACDNYEDAEITERRKRTEKAQRDAAFPSVLGYGGKTTKGRE